MNQEQYVFIAWGIGITPFRSIIKNLIDTNRHEEITLFYLATNENKFLFQDIFDEAKKQYGLKTIFLKNETKLDETLLKKYFKDLQTIIFYLSGPQKKVERQRDVLMNAGISNNQIKTDLFTGYDK